MFKYVFFRDTCKKDDVTQLAYFPWFAGSEQEKNVCLFVSSSAMLSSKSLLTGSVEVDPAGPRNF